MNHVQLIWQPGPTVAYPLQFSFYRNLWPAGVYCCITGVWISCSLLSMEMILGGIPRSLLLSVSLQIIGSAENSKQEGQNQRKNKQMQGKKMKNSWSGPDHQNDRKSSHLFSSHWSKPEAGTVKRRISYQCNHIKIFSRHSLPSPEWGKECGTQL